MEYLITVACAEKDVSAAQKMLATCHTKEMVSLLRLHHIQEDLEDKCVLEADLYLGHSQNNLDCVQKVMYKNNCLVSPIN